MADTSSKTYDWAALCKEFDPDDKKDVAYEFSNGKKILNKDLVGVYE